MSEEVEERLRREIEKWQEKLEGEFDEGVDGDEEFVENVEAYLKDSRYFEERGLLVESFEALVWAWSWLEIGEKVGRIDRDND